jgi:general secretion pathway protein D
LRYWIIRLLLCMSLFIAPTLAEAKGVILNFSDVDIATMVKFISDLTGKNFVMDERVKGKISVYSPAKLSPEEAYNVFTSVLELKGFTIVPAGRVHKIIPIAMARQSGMKILAAGESAPVNESYVARVIALDYISSQEAVTFLQPLISKDGYVSAFGPGNLLLVVDSNLNIEKILGILELIDTDQVREGGELLFLKNAPADTVAKVVQEWLGGRSGKPAGQVSVAAPGNLVVADPRLNALILFGNDKDKLAIKRLVAMIDVPPPTTSSKVNVYYLENADATEMAKVLDGVVKGMTAANTPAGQPAPQGSPLDTKITITPDKATNALVIMAAPADYQNLLQVIKKLDRRSRQVFVQVLIAEVSLDKSRELGLQSGVIGGAALNDYLAVAGIYDPLGTFASVLGGLSGSTTGGAATSSLLSNFQPRPANVTSVLKALDKNGLLNILSTPNILTSDNKEAEINVGENVPFQGASTVTTGFSTTSVERKDIGINLKIKPQISEGDYIRMDINQEISAVKDSKGQAIDLVTTKRSAKTSIVVKDKETVVIGGLIQDTENETVSKIPFLGDIPVLGWLFKTKSKTRQKTNLMIMLTPNIVKDASELAAVTDDQRTRFGEATKRTDSVDIPVELMKQNQVKPAVVAPVPAQP